MTRAGLFVCALATLLGAHVWLSPATVFAEGLTKAEVGKLGKAATVYVLVKDGSGSGFCVHPSGLVITNAHVVKDSAEVTVVLNASLENQKVLKAKVLRTEKELDLALLRIAGDAEIPALALGYADKLAELADVVACGFPFGKYLATKKDEYPAMSINAGTITALRRKDGALHRLQMDVEINPGNSGGPVLDMNGTIVGVVDAAIRGAGISSAIPVTHVIRFMNHPIIELTAPTLTRANQHQSLEFQARATDVIPNPRPLNLELILRVGASPERHFDMRLDDEVYRVAAVPVPQDVVPRLDLFAQFETGGAVEGVIDDREIQVGDQKIKMSGCRRILLQTKPMVVLADGKTIEGQPAGLDEVAVTVGGQTLTLNLSQATTIRIEPPPPISAVECTVVARRDEIAVGRLASRLAIQGVSRVEYVEPANPTHVEIRPPEFTGDALVKNLPEIARDICVGGGGRYLVLHLPKLKKLAIFDVNVAAIVRYIPLAEDKAVYAAGLDKLVVGLPAKGALERYDLHTGAKELVRPAPSELEGASWVLLGAASRGPLVANGALFDLEMLKPLDIKRHGNPGRFSPVSADGTVFGAWKAQESVSTTFVLQGNELMRYDEGGQGHVVPGPDGRTVYTVSGVRTSQLKAWRGGPSKPGYCLPAVEGNFFLSLTPPEGKNGGSMAVYLLDHEYPLVKDVGIAHGIHFDDWDRTTFGPWKRIFLIPRAKLIVVFPESQDRLELHRFDVDEALEKSALDYLLITSRPPATARRGAELTYQIVAKSRLGSLKYQLGSGPTGMEVSPTGLVKWQVPADAMETAADVIITVSDAQGQELFHTFTLRLVDAG